MLLVFKRKRVTVRLFHASTFAKFSHITFSYAGQVRETTPEYSLPFYSSDEFYPILSEFVSEHGPFTEESLDEYLDDTLGSVDWDR